MAFNFKQYTANNPLLQPLEEDGPNVTMGDMAAYSADQEAGEPLEEEDGVSDIEAYGSASTEEMEGMGSQMDEADAYPRAEFADAVYKACQAGLDKETLHKLVDWNC